MKKSSKKILISCLSILPIIPTAAILTSCKSNETVTVPNAKWTADFDKVKVFTGVVDSKDLIKRMKEDIDSNPILQKICIALNISIQNGYEVQLVKESLQELSNNLYFTIKVGRKADLQTDNTLYIKEYSCAIMNINKQANNIFDNKLISNDIINNNNDSYTNELSTIIELQDKTPTTSQIGNELITLDSSKVQEELRNLEKKYTLENTEQQKSSLVNDLEYLIKDTFITNFKNWRIPSDIFKTYLPFGCVKLQQNAKANAVNIELCLQIKNSSKNKQNFEFLNNNLILNKDDILTIKISCNNISQNELLTINKQGYVSLKFNKPTIKYQLNKKVENLNMNELIMKSYSINTKFNNIGSDNNPFNENTQQKFAEIFDKEKESLTLDKIQNIVEEQIQNEYATKKDEALINLSLIEKFTIPAIKTPEEYKEFDIDNNNIYSLYDLIGNLGKPLGEWYRLKKLDDAAVIVENIFSGEPLYRTFRNMFPTLVKLLRGMNSTVVNDIVDFLEQSLTINGKPKTEAQFKDFFVNISNLKEVVKPLLQNSGAITGYQLYLILELIDTLSTPIEQSLWNWLSSNFKKVVKIINTFIPQVQMNDGMKEWLNNLYNSKNLVDTIIKNIGKVSELLNLLFYTINHLGEVSVDYKEQKDVNWLTDVDLYDLFERKNGLVIHNSPYILQAIYPNNRDPNIIKNSVKKIVNLIGLAGGAVPPQLKPILSLVKNALNSVMEETTIPTLLRTTFGQVMKLLSNWKTSSTINIWENAFRSFFIPKTINGSANDKKITILDVFKNLDNEAKLYKTNNINWSDLTISTPEARNISLNKKLTLDVELPTIEYDYYSSSYANNAWVQNAVAQKTVNTINSEYYFPNSSLIPIVNNSDLSVSWKAQLFKNTNDIESNIFCLEKETMLDSSIYSNQKLSVNDEYFADYNQNILDEKYWLDISKFFKKDEKNKKVPIIDILLSDLVQVNSQTNMYWLSDSAYNQLLENMYSLSNTINLNKLTLRPIAYITKDKNTYKVNLKFPTNIYINEKILGKDTKNFKDNISFQVNVK